MIGRKGTLQVHRLIQLLGHGTCSNRTMLHLTTASGGHINTLFTPNWQSYALCAWNDNPSCLFRAHELLVTSAREK